MPKTKTSPNSITTCIRNWRVSRSAAYGVALAGGLLSALVACEEPKDIGLSPTTPVGVFYTDTLTVVRSTVQLDSVRSNAMATLMVGRYADPALGRVQASAFTQLALPTSPATGATVGIVIRANDADVPASDILYDSTRLFMTYESTFGDTLQAQELLVYPLRDSINTRATYDISSPAPRYADQPIARQSVRPAPRSQGLVRLNVADAYGRQLLALANTDAGRNNVPFRAQFPGLAILSRSAPGAALLNFTVNPASTALVVYYHTRTDTTARTIPFSVGAGRFNQVLADRSGTPLASLRPGQSLPAASTGGRTYVQPLTGVTTRLTFPGLANILQSGRVAINRADLIITPRPPENALLPRPALVTLAEVGPQNQLIRTPTLQLVQFVQQPGRLFDRTELTWVTPQIQSLDARAQTYAFEIGGYLQSLINGTDTGTGLALLTPGSTLIAPVDPTTNSVVPANTQFYLNSRAARMLLDGQASARLVLFYTVSR